MWKPAPNQQALNPIIYLKMDDPTQPGKNLGTGGDFVLNGVVARSGRGPSQFNAPYSDLDGAADYLSRTSITGIADSNKATICFSLCCTETTTPIRFVVYMGVNGSHRFIISRNHIVSGDLLIEGRDSSNTVLLSAYTLAASKIVSNRNAVVALSFDLSDSSKRYLYINGASASVAWATYTNGTIAFTSASGISIGAARNFNTSSVEGYWLGRLGNVFFDTKYIDLSQPANLAKFVTGTGIDAKPADLGANGEKPFGTAPLIYLPMYGNNAGKNYGTGGDFSVVSGPFAGSRGPNEYFGNKADFNGSTGYLSRTSALSGVINSSTFSCSFFVSPDTSAQDPVIHFHGPSGWMLMLRVDSAGGRIFLFAMNDSTGSDFIDLYSKPISGIPYPDVITSVQISMDTTNPTRRVICINGVVSTLTVNTYASGVIPFSQTSYVHIGHDSNNTYYDGKLSEFYFTTDYIDFSQEANRLKFRDAFGNPVDLTPQIEAGTLPNPAIYMRFDPANFGKNLGTGGDFVVNGTITDGGQL